jgi:purine-binding chemotaxis protein CheW
MKTDKISKSEVHLIFRLGKKYFAVPVSKASNIIEISRMTSINRNNCLVIGNVNLRGTLVPIVNLHSKFGTKLEDFTYNNSVLVLETNNNEKYHVGIIIDALLEVLEIKLNEIDYGTSKQSLNGITSIKGYYNKNKHMQIGILEPENIFTNDEISMLKSNV